MNEFVAKIPGQMGASPQTDPPQSAADQALSAGRDVQNAAVDLASSSADAIKGHAADLVDAAKDVASQAGDRLQETISEQKGFGADYVDKLADTMRRVANECDADVPIAGIYIRKAAGQITDAADAIRTGNLNDLLQGARSFARSQPTAFLGLAVLAGFGAVRFLKSSPATASGGDRETPRARESASNASFQS